MRLLPIQREVGYLLVLMVLPPLAMADIRNATGKPLLDFYTVYGAIDSVKIINELCNVNFPEYVAKNDRAYKLWKTKYEAFIYKVEQYNHAVANRESGGKDASYVKQMLETAKAYENNKVAMHQLFSGYGDAVYRSTCASYPEYTKSEKADFQNYYREHMQVFENIGSVIRDIRPAKVARLKRINPCIVPSPSYEAQW